MFVLETYVNKQNEYYNHIAETIESMSLGKKMVVEFKIVNKISRRKARILCIIAGHLLEKGTADLEQPFKKPLSSKEPSVDNERDTIFKSLPEKL